jgi:hypothetical protein
LSRIVGGVYFPGFALNFLSEIKIVYVYYYLSFGVISILLLVVQVNYLHVFGTVHLNVISFLVLYVLLYLFECDVIIVFL